MSMSQGALALALLALFVAILALFAAAIFTATAALCFLGAYYERARRRKEHDAFMSRHIRRIYDNDPESL